MTDPKPPIDDDFDSIAPADVALTRDPPSGEEQGRRPGQWSLGRLAGVAVALLIAAVLLLWLPDVLRPDLDSIANGPERPTPGAVRERENRDDGDGNQAAGADREDAEPIAPYEQSRFERERRAVEDSIARLLDLQEELEVKAVDRWGAEAFAAAGSLAREGDQAFITESFETARARYQAAIMALEELLDAATGAFDDAIERGRAALDGGQSAAAEEAFGLAAAIRPEASSAQRGLQRAAVLDDVLAAMAEAERLLARDELRAAEVRLEAALELDDETAAARTALASVRERIKDRDFNAALSRGYAALAEGRLEEARKAFREAQGLRPGTAEVAEGLLFVNRSSTDLRITALRQEAEALLEAEQWGEAAERYTAALELDDSLSFARQGRREALTLADLEARILETLAKPDRLSEDPLLEEARELLTEAQAIPAPRPGFSAQIAELDELIDVAAQPVPVVLSSDAATDVTILRVARLGSFERQEMELRPGLYTATGTRPGYRDVRIEFRVAADSATNEVTIRTRERI